MTAVVLLVVRCPKCGAESESYRRHGPHAPCAVCLVNGQVVRMVPRDAPPPSHVEAREPVRVVPPPTAAAVVGAAGIAWNCDRDGHVFVGPGACGHCGAPHPADPAAGVRK